MKTVKTNLFQNIFRIILGLWMALAALSHFTFARAGLQAQVPNWIPLNKDLVVILSGVVEVGLALAMIFWKKERALVGIALAVFFVLIFPGNINQYVNHVNSLGMNTDQPRLIRLFFQPVLIWLALWSTGAITSIRNRIYDHKQIEKFNEKGDSL